MNRLLKFRVWDKTQNRYLDTRDNVNYQLKPTYEESRGVEMGRGVGFVNLGWAMQRSEQYGVEQFTGLLDKNGKEIYEGDIIRYGFDAEAKDGCQQSFWNKAVVEWGVVEDDEYGEDVLGWTLKSVIYRSLISLYPIINMYPAYVGATGHDDGYWRRYNGSYEIIGNIHENPELLNPS